MGQIQARQRLRGFLYSRAVIFLLLIFAAMTVRSAFEAFTRWRLVSRELERVNANFELLAERKRLLEVNLQALETPRGMDAEIRRKFLVAGEGERVISILPPVPSASTAPEEPETDESVLPSIFDWRPRWFRRI